MDRMLCLVLAGMVFLGGCAAMEEMFHTDRYRFLSPGKLVRPPARGGSPISPILQSVTISDQAQELVPNAVFPAEGDYEYTAEDYVIGPTDILDISILDLFSEGMESVIRRQVTASGLVDLPMLPERVRAEKYSAMELKEVIADAYSPEILRDPTVSVTVTVRRQSTFSILGAIRGPGKYTIARRDMRLLDAIALAGDVSQTNIRWIYIIRQTPPVRRPAKTTPVRAKGAATEPAALPPLPEIPSEEAPTRPAAETREADLRELRKVIPGVVPAEEPEKPREPASRESPETLPVPADMPRLAEAGASAPAAAGTSEVDVLGGTRTYKWVYSDGRWIQVAQEAPLATRPSGEGAPPVRPAGRPSAAEADRMRKQEDPFGWKKIDKSDTVRIIAINLGRLRSGDPRMNIMIRDNDMIHVPVLKMGEFYMMGEVNRPGVYSLTGRRITLKMALAAAGSFGGLAWPKNSLLIRRIGDNQEQTIPLDLQAIVRGEEADIFLKPNDVIAVGTDVRASFMAVVRYSFRMTYGFGFIYDRNFANPPLAEATSKRFTRW